MSGKRSRDKLEGPGATSTSNCAPLPPSKSSSTPQFTIEVLEGRNFSSKHPNGFTDPYCKIGVASKTGQEFCNKQQPIRSDVKFWSTKPVWKKAKYSTDDSEFRLRVEVWDHFHEKSDEFIGSTIIELHRQYDIDEWVPLLPLHSGEIRLQIKRNTAPLEPNSNVKCLIRSSAHTWDPLAENWNPTLERKKLDIGTSNMKKVVLIAAGSFNPITHMHLRLFERGKSHLIDLGYHVAGGFITPVSDAYPKKGLISSAHRVNMCQAAIESSSWISVDLWELSQRVYTRTLHVLDHFAEELKSEEIAPLLLCGGDLVESFNKPGVWKPEQIEEILSKYGLVCMERSSTNLKEVIAANELLTKYAKTIHIFADVANEISSTSVRNYVSEGWSVKYLVPDAVEKYILEQKLYQKEVKD